MPQRFNYRKEEPPKPHPNPSVEHFKDFPHREKLFESTISNHIAKTGNMVKKSQDIPKCLTGWERYKPLKKAYDQAGRASSYEHEEYASLESLVFAIAEFLLIPYEEYLKEKNDSKPR